MRTTPATKNNQKMISILIKSNQAALNAHQQKQRRSLTNDWHANHNIMFKMIFKFVAVTVVTAVVILAILLKKVFLISFRTLEAAHI